MEEGTQFFCPISLLPRFFLLFISFFLLSRQMQFPAAAMTQGGITPSTRNSISCQKFIFTFTPTAMKEVLITLPSLAHDFLALGAPNVTLDGVV